MPKTKKPTLAERADRYVCYQKSVQEPAHEVEFFDQAYKDAFGRKPVTLREDFCGTFAVCCEFVKAGPKRTALGVDLDPEPLEWGRKHNLDKLTPAQRKRVTLRQADVRSGGKPRADILAAQNFSFWIFKTRAEVLSYLKTARGHLNKDGLMVLDMMGGGDCYIEGHKDVRTVKKGKHGFKYLWEQHSYNPLTHDASFYIHFKFADGSKLHRAFEYHWRFWTMAEIRELCAEAGFSETHVYWEKLDKHGEETGEWERAKDAPSDASWVCYIVAVR